MTAPWVWTILPSVMIPYWARPQRHQNKEQTPRAHHPPRRARFPLLAPWFLLVLLALSPPLPSALGQFAPDKELDAEDLAAEEAEIESLDDAGMEEDPADAGADAQEDAQDGLEDAEGFEPPDDPNALAQSDALDEDMAPEGLEDPEETEENTGAASAADLVDPGDVGSAPSEGVDIEGRLQRSDSALARGDLEEALSIWRDVPNADAIKMDVYDRVVRAYMQRKEHVKALEVLILQKALLDAAETSDPVLGNAALAVAVQNDMLMMIKKLQEHELQSVAERYAPRFPADEALLRLVDLYEAQDDFYRQGQEIKRFLALFPNHAGAGGVRRRSDGMREKIKAVQHRIGVILPLRGTMAPFGQAALNGIRLAIEHLRALRPKMSVGLIVREVEEEVQPLAGWLSEYRPLALIGPLLSKEVVRLAPVIEKTPLTMITPGATAPQLPGIGQSVIRNAMTHRAQCQALVEQATKMRLKRFAILYPRGRFGLDWTKCFSEEVIRRGGQVTTLETYAAGETDFSEPITRLKNAAGKKVGDTRVAFGFDALFLPTDPQEAGLIIPQLAFHNVRGITLLGLSSWNDPQFLTLAGRYAEGAVFADGFFHGSTHPPIARFVEEYQKRFGQPPDLLAAQAYDATRWVLSAIEGGAETPGDVKEAVARIRQYDGVSGLLSEIRGGEAIKTPFFIQVKKGKFVQIY